MRFPKSGCNRNVYHVRWHSKRRSKRKCSYVLAAMIGHLRDLPLVPTKVGMLLPPVLVIPRKEVIQPHLPIRLPCYDLVPLTGITFGASLLAVGTTTTGAANSGGL